MLRAESQMVRNPEIETSGKKPVAGCKLLAGVHCGGLTCMSVAAGFRQSMAPVWRCHVYESMCCVINWKASTLVDAADHKNFVLLLSMVRFPSQNPASALALCGHHSYAWKNKCYVLIEIQQISKNGAIPIQFSMFALRVNQQCMGRVLARKQKTWERVDSRKRGRDWR